MAEYGRMGFTGDVKNISEGDKAALAGEDSDESAEEIMDGLREPTFVEYGEAKRAAREAAARIMGY